MLCSEFVISSEFFDSLIDHLRAHHFSELDYTLYRIMISLKYIDSININKIKPQKLR
jgi:hypothetical protein